MEKLTGKNILVTGGTGFVGSHLVEALIKLGATVIVPYRSSDPRSYFYTRKLYRKVIMAQCDIKDFQRVLDVITKYEIDYIFHLASQAIVTTALHNPLETLETNIMGSTHILEAARLYGKIQGIIVASSDKAYGKSNKAYTETDPLNGDHPYEVSKSSEDLIAQMYYKTYKLPVIITRFGNIYGPGDLNANRIIPGILKSVIRKEKLHIRSDGTYVRDYVYVEDVVSGYLFLLRYLPKTVGKAFNLSSDNSYSVISLIKKTNKVLRVNVRYTIDNTAVNEIPYQRLSFAKISLLGWKPRFDLRRGLLLTYRWYKKHKPFKS